MGLPILYYDGRNNPPHGEIWINYYLKIFSLYASKVLSIAIEESNDNKQERLSHLSKKAKDFLNYLDKNNVLSFTPIELANKFRKVAAIEKTQQNQL